MIKIKSRKWAKSIAREVKNYVTRENAVNEGKTSFWKFDFFNFALWTNVKRKKLLHTYFPRYLSKYTNRKSKSLSISDVSALRLIYTPSFHMKRWLLHPILITLHVIDQKNKSINLFSHFGLKILHNHPSAQKQNEKEFRASRNYNTAK